MFLLYSIVYSLGFIALLPVLLLRRQKYASGFRERLGNYPEFKQDGGKVIWLHCVSVGETNAARPLVDKLIAEFPDHRIVISATTRTGQELAQKIFKDKADAVFYLPFDWKFSVRRALCNFQPSTILLMETEIWPRLISEAKISGAKIVIVNGRLSEKSFRRYSLVKSFVRRVLQNIDLALMQNEKDAKRIKELGMDMDVARVKITGNLKFDLSIDSVENDLTEEFRDRFGINGESPIIVAASTHEPEEESIINTLFDVVGYDGRLIVAPRHPQRFDAVAKLLEETQFSFVRRSSPPSEVDRTVSIILLDSIGELRAVYPLADIVFVGGSLIPHGGQSVLEPAAAGKAIVVGPYTHNFEMVVKGLLEREAIIQTSLEYHEMAELYSALTTFLYDPKKRLDYGNRALDVINANRGATEKTVEYLRSSNILSN